MSALVIEKAKGGIRCREPGCKNSGRYRLRIAGYYVMAEGTLTHQKELLCRKHAEAAQELWDELTGNTREAQVTAAVIALLGSRSEALDAVEDLRALGFSGEQVVEARRGITEQRSVEEIVGVLLDGEREAIAA